MTIAAATTITSAATATTDYSVFTIVCSRMPYKSPSHKRDRRLLTVVKS